MGNGRAEEQLHLVRQDPRAMEVAVQQAFSLGYALLKTFLFR